MKLEHQVCTLEQAKRLKELGVTARSIFMHSEHLEGSVITNTDTAVHLSAMDYAPAYTVAELMQAINWDYVSISAPYQEDNTWDMFLRSDKISGLMLSHVLADTIIYQLENNLITTEQINKRLNG